MKARHANKRTAAQRVRDRAEIAACYLRGEPQHAIAARLGLSRQQIGYDLGLIKEEWRHSAARDFEAHQAEELAKLDALEAVYWAAWERSQQELVHSTQEKIDDEISMPGGRRGLRIKVPRSRSRAALRKDQQVGNSAFLFGIERCIELRCKILGLHAPTNITLNGTMSFADLWQLAQEGDGATEPHSHGLVALPGGRPPQEPAPADSELDPAP